MKQYKDELLVACLTLILSLPQQIVIVEMTNIAIALQVGVHIIASPLIPFMVHHYFLNNGNYFSLIRWL